MLHLSFRLGNVHINSEFKDQTLQWQKAGLLDEMTIEERDARKSRLRLHTAKGRDIGVTLPRGSAIEDGDVFAVEEDGSRVLVHIALQEVMVLTPRETLVSHERWAWAVRLGHVLGNQHWPVAVVGEQILTPVTVDRAVMETVLKTHHLTDYFLIHYERRSWPKDEGNTQWTIHH
jgi:urease accessory protein